MSTVKKKSTSTKAAAAGNDSIVSQPAAATKKELSNKKGKSNKKKGPSSSSSSLSSSESSQTLAEGSSLLENSRKKNSKLNEAFDRQDENAKKIKRLQGVNGPRGKERQLTPRSKRLQEEYEKIKYVEDTEITPWQRQLRVNRFMAELQVRQNVHELVDPIVKTQTILKTQVDHSFVKTFEDIQRRLVLLEQSVFGQDGPENRFDRIEKNHIELIKNQKQHYKYHNDKRAELETKVDNEIFTFHNRVQKVELFEKDITELYSTSKELQQKFLQSTEEMKREINTFSKNMKDALDKNTGKLHKNSQDMVLTQDRVEKLEMLDREGADHRTKLEQQLIDQKAELARLADRKLDAADFNNFVPQVEKDHNSLVLNVEEMKESIDTTANFLEKYLPMQVQRAITHVLGFVFPQKDVAWRMNWYNELRMPLLSAALLNDYGKQNLTRKMAEMTQMYENNPTSILEIDADEQGVKCVDELFEDERLLSNGLRSMKLHTKAKVLIFDHIDRLDRHRDKLKKSNVKFDDYELQVNFQKLQDELFALLCKEDPQEAKKLGILPSSAVQSEDGNEVQILDEDEDNGLETQVQDIVDKFTREFELRNAKRLKEVQTELDEKIQKNGQYLSQKMESHVKSLEKSDGMIHMTHITDFKSIQGVHQEYIKAQERFDQKLSIVVDLENAYQLLLQHMQNTTKVVNQLIDINVDSIKPTAIQPAETAGLMTRTSSSPELASRGVRRSYNVDTAQSPVEEDARSETELRQEQMDATEKKAIENLRLESLRSSKDHTADSQNDYKQASRRVSKVNLGGAEKSEVLSSSVDSNQSQKDPTNFMNYFNPSLGASKIGTSSVRSVKNHQFMHSRGQQRFKQYNSNLQQQVMGPSELNQMVDSPVFSHQDGAIRPKSQAAGSHPNHHHVRRNTAAAGSMVTMAKVKNSVLKFEIPVTQGQPSATSIAFQPSRNVIKEGSQILQSRSSCRTTQNWQPGPMKGKTCNMHIQQRRNQSRSFANQKYSQVLSDGKTYSGFKDLSTHQQSHRTRDFDRSVAIQKLQDLNSEAKQLAKTVNKLMYPAKDSAKEEEKKIKKKIDDHKKALNMLPDATQFKNELINFKQELTQKSTAQAMLEKHGSFLTGGRLHQLNFATQGINMNFGIGHEKQYVQSNQHEVTEETKKEDARAKRQKTPNRLASEQEFGRPECNLASSKRQHTQGSSHSQVSSRRDHIFCKKEVMNSVSRVL